VISCTVDVSMSRHSLPRASTRRGAAGPLNPGGSGREPHPLTAWVANRESLKATTRMIRV
jgi:hypothetical protein